MLKSLQSRIILSLTVVLLLSGCLLSVVLYRASADLITKALGDQAKVIAEQAAKKIKLEPYQTLSAESPYYQELRLLLNEMKLTYGLKYLYTMGQRDRNGESEYYYVVDGAPLEAKEDFSAFGKVESEPYPALAAVFTQKSVQIGDLSNDQYGATLTAYVPIKNASGEMIGVVGADFDASSVYDRLQQNRIFIIWLTAAMLLLSIAAIWLIAKILIQPLKRLNAVITVVQSGDLRVSVETGRSDEIGMLSRSFQRMVDDLSAIIRGIRDNASQLQHASHQLAETAEHTGQSAEQVTSAIREVATGSAVHMKQVGETARSMESVSAAIERIAGSSAIASSASLAAMTEAKHGNAQVDKAMSQMETIVSTTNTLAESIAQLEHRSAEIGHIVQTMTGIAAQTNILALNASIEAARAGQHGQGFSVVAGEVRKLAAQSQQSAQQIAALIEQTAADTDNVVTAIQAGTAEVQAGMQAVHDANRTFHAIQAEVERVTEQVRDVSTASREIAAGSQIVRQSVSEMERITRDAVGHNHAIAQSSERQAAALEQMTGATESLNERVEQLNAMIARFKV